MGTFSRNCILLISAILLLLSRTGDSANILFYFGFASYSHRIAVWPLVESLAERGHNITFISPNFPKKPNPKVIEISPLQLQEMMAHELDSILDNRIKGSLPGNWEMLPVFGYGACEKVLTSPEIKEWVSKKPQFDLVVVDGLFNECGIGMAHKFNAKFLIFSTSTMMMWFPDVVGSLPDSSWVPELNYFYQTPMNFLQRVHNTIIPLYWHFWLRNRNYLPGMDALIRKELEVPNMPPLQELERQVSLIFLTTHHSVEYARSLPPIYVPVGGMHIVESHSEIPKDIAKFIDESGPEGVIYVSFGSAAKASKLPAEIKDVFYKVLGSFKKLRFIWKFDIDRPSDLPANIMTAQWIPQQELLAHKKLKGFITHGGYGSIQEATYWGVPLIVFPLFAEQDYNANLVDKSGAGIKLEIIGIDEKTLRDAILALTTDKKYGQRMSEISKLFKDRPMKPVETAVWWTEYVLRTQDTSSLKPLSAYQTWYERRLLDVWLFLFAVPILGVLVLGYLVCKCCSGKKQESSKRDKVKKS